MSGKRLYLLLLLLIVAAVLISLYLFFSRKEDILPRKEISLSPDEKEWLIRHKNSITYINDTAFPPVSFIDDSGNYTGISEDYIRLLELKLNIRIKRIYTKTWKEAVHLVKSGKVEILGAIAVTPDRLKYLIFTPPFIDAKSIFLTRKNHEKIISSSDLKFKRVAVTESYAVDEYLQITEPSIIRIPVHNDLEGLIKVSSGESDAAASDYATASYMIEKYGLTNLKIAAETGMDYHLCFGVIRSNQILASIMIKGVNSITDEEFRVIKQKWIHLDMESFMFSRKLWITIALLLFMIISGSVIFIIWNRLLSTKVEEKTRELNIYKNKLEMLVEERTQKLQSTVTDLNEALEKVKNLRGLIPICSKCKKIRDDEGYWKQTEEYIRDHSEAEFSHSLCPNCAGELYGKEKWFRKVFHPPEE